MHTVTSRRTRSIVALAGLAMIAATFSVTASFEAPGPGASLQPVGGADELVQVLQSNRVVLWSSLGDRVSSYVVRGWPVDTGDEQLGGALVIERPGEGVAGVIDFGEKPMSVQFELGG